MSTWMGRVAKYNRRLGEHPSVTRRAADDEPWRVGAVDLAVINHVHIQMPRRTWLSRLRGWRKPQPSMWGYVHETSRRISEETR